MSRIPFECVICGKTLEKPKAGLGITCGDEECRKQYKLYNSIEYDRKNAARIMKYRKDYYKKYREKILMQHKLIYKRLKGGKYGGKKA
jgi:hypothetical protein